MLNVQNKNSSYFVEWIPNNVRPASLLARAGWLAADGGLGDGGLLACCP